MSLRITCNLSFRCHYSRVKIFGDKRSNCNIINIMFQSSLLLILVFLPIASTLDYFFMNSYSNAALDDITSLAVNHNATIFVSAYGPQFFLYNNDTTNSYILRHQVPVAGIINSIDITKDGESIALGLNNY